MNYPQEIEAKHVYEYTPEPQFCLWCSRRGFRHIQVATSQGPGYLCWRCHDELNGYCEQKEREVI